jgi:hypothetical protein
MMFRFLNTVGSSTGELPQVGDCDDGRTELLVDDLGQMVLLPVAERNSLRVPGLLGLGQRLFGEGKGDGDDAAWYGLTAATPVPYSKPCITPGAAQSVEVLPKAGIGVLRHGSAELLFFAIPNGIFGKGSHTHNDKLSFVLRISDQEILCDSGTGCYTRDVATRNQFRGTAAHNTLLIDGTEQNRIFPGPRGLFILGNEAAVSPIQAGGETRERFLRASHAGYQSLGVMHTRTVRAADGEPAFVIEDELDGEGVHDFELHLQLPPNRNAEVVSAENGILCRILGDPEVRLIVTGSGLLQGEVRPSLISTTYGATVPSSRVRVSGRTKVPARITTHISWPDVAGAKSRQSESAKKITSRDAVAERVCQA